MSISDKNLDDITETDLQALITDGVPEGPRIEYKRQTYGTSDNDKKEFLKDASSFANTWGGHLIIGMNAHEGVAAEIVPFIGDIDGELLRLESLFRDGIEPRISGASFRAVPTATGVVFVLRIPRSWNAPHRVAFKSSNRFFARSSAGAYELGVAELRSKFNSSATAFDRAILFRERRLALLSSDEGTVPLAKVNGRLSVHIFPLGTTGEPIVEMDRITGDIQDLLAPIDAGGWSPEFNFDGFANVRSGEQFFGYTQLFRDGSIEATKVRVTAEERGVHRIPALSLGTPLVKAVKKYASALQQLGVPAPLSVMITLDGVKGAYLGYSNSQWLDDPAVIRKGTLQLPPVLIAEYGSDRSYEAALRPAFDALWNAGGLPKCTYYSDEGGWAPHD